MMSPTFPKLPQHLPRFTVLPVGERIEKLRGKADKVGAHRSHMDLSAGFNHGAIENIHDIISSLWRHASPSSSDQSLEPRIGQLSHIFPKFGIVVSKGCSTNFIQQSCDRFLLAEEPSLKQMGRIELGRKLHNLSLDAVWFTKGTTLFAARRALILIPRNVLTKAVLVFYPPFLGIQLAGVGVLIGIR